MKVKFKETKRAKTIPLIVALANKITKDIGFEEKANELLKYDAKKRMISPGALLKSIVLATFFDMRVPLSRISDRFEPFDVEYLFCPGITHADLDEYKIGRVLEELGKADFNGLYEELALTALQKNDIETKILHSDTTTISFYGEYLEDEDFLTEEEKEEVLKIERGYNKDGRPQCKQVVVGQIVNETGIPIVSRTLNGSTSDTKWNEKALNYLKDMSKEGFSYGIYVADSKLITEELVLKMTKKNEEIYFVSRCPSNFAKKLEGQIIKEFYENKDKWEDYGSFSDSKNASKYTGCSFIKEVFGVKLRLLCVESSKLLEKTSVKFEKISNDLETVKKELTKKTFKCKEDAEIEFQRFLKRKETKMFDFDYEIEECIKEKYPVGRRSSKTKPIITSVFKIKLESRFNETKKQEFINQKSCFVLISNVFDENISDKEILKIYKGQHVVENSFRNLKGPNLASVIYLKNETRIQALSMILTFSLLVRALIEYRMKKGFKEFKDANPTEDLRVGWSNKKLISPTYKLLFEATKNCAFERENLDISTNFSQESDVCEPIFTFCWGSTKVEKQVTALFELMKMDITVLLE